MAGYQPLYIRGNETGLVQSRQEFILPNDAYPILENAFVWRERIKRKQGYQLLGRLQRAFSISLVLVGGAGILTNFPIVPGSIRLVGNDDGTTYTDPTMNGALLGTGGSGSGGTINYATGAITIIAGGGETLAGTYNYYPLLPVMGIRLWEQQNSTNDVTIFWDTVYAYQYLNGFFQEFLPGTVWTGSDSEFFWTTNYWVDSSMRKIVWTTNFSASGDPIRYTNGQTGTNWINFTPIINAAGNTLNQALAILPFRGRLIVFNTRETDGPHSNRIRWAAIGNPFTVTSAIIATVNVNAWRSDIRGQGGFLDIPTSEDIVSVGFVRDNLVIYCERSTWQLRYTGRTIAPFQIEKVNSELGVEATFSSVQFDTSLVGIGDKGVVECDSFKSERIDIKIPDLVFTFQTANNGLERVHGIRDFEQRLAYWIYPYAPGAGISTTYPNRRLVYNYENDSWAIFTDSLTALGTFQPQSARTWASYAVSAPSDPAGNWELQNYPWINRVPFSPAILGGNQQGFVEYLDSQVSNDISLAITNIIGNTTTPTVITVPNHNLQPTQVIQISGIPIGTPFASTLNGNIFGVVPVDINNLQLWLYDPESGNFDVTPEKDPPGVYIGCGNISIRDGFRIVSKKFNFLEEGQNIQLGFIDVLMNSTANGAISLNVYLDYQELGDTFNQGEPSNLPPQNNIPDSDPPIPDTFFNSIVPTSAPNANGITGTKYWQRIFCPTRAAFLTLEWTLSNAQLVGPEQQQDVQIDAHILHVRRAGTQLPIGV